MIITDGGELVTADARERPGIEDDHGRSTA
jgi:hypothetical protein